MNEKTDTCPDCSNHPCDCGMPAGYAPTPTPWTDANEEDGWNPCGWAVDSNLVRELERELAAVTEQRDGLRSAVDYASDQLTRVTEQRDEARRLAEKYRNLSCDSQEEADETLLPWENNQPKPESKDTHRFCRGGGGNNFHCGCKYDG